MNPRSEGRIVARAAGVVVHESLNASLGDKVCGEIGVRFIQELLAALPEEANHLNFSGDLAMLLFNLHRHAEAEQLCQKLIQSQPDRAVGYVNLSDGLLRGSLKDLVERIGRLKSDPLAADEIGPRSSDSHWPPGDTRTSYPFGKKRGRATCCG